MKKKFFRKMIATIMFVMSLTTFSSISETKAIASTTLPINGWYKDDSNWYYLNNNIKTSGWLKYDGKWYYFYSDGRLAKDWINYNEKVYYADSTGVIIKGFINIFDNWYYFGQDYSMQTGWQKINEQWFYFYDDGTMAFNRVIDGYYVDENGKLSPDAKTDTKMTYDNAIGKAINYAFGNYNYITPFKFEKGTIIQNNNYTFAGLLAQEDKNLTSNEILFSSQPLTNQNVADFDLFSKDKWIVASAILSKDGSYHVTGQFYSIRAGMGKAKFINNPKSTCEADNNAYITVYPNGKVEINGILSTLN